VIVTERSVPNGWRRVTDTWATCPATGEQGLTTVRYEELDSLDLLEAE
jgi:hypothetical protein